MTRTELVNSGHLVFREQSQRSDLLNPHKTNTGLIAYLSQQLGQFGYHLEVTAVNTTEARTCTSAPARCKRGSSTFRSRLL